MLQLKYIIMIILMIMPACAELNSHNNITKYSNDTELSPYSNIGLEHSYINHNENGFFISDNLSSDSINYSNAYSDMNFTDVMRGAVDLGPSIIGWQKCLGGNGSDVAQSVQQTSDGGYIVAGYTESNDGDVNGYLGSTDAWVVKLDANHAIQWQRCLGTNTSIDYAYNIQQTADGGYVFAGSVSYSAFYIWAWVAKLSSSGDMEWQKYFDSACSANSIHQTTDGGYIVAGMIGNSIDRNFWIAKLAPNGAAEWEKTLGGSYFDGANSVQQTSDGGYVVTGYANSYDGNVGGNHGGSDLWVVKLNSGGDMQWQKCLGGSDNDGGTSIQQTTDGGYIIAGYTSSNNGDVSLNQGSEDYWVVKIDSEGTIQWQRCLGGSTADAANSVRQTSDGGYVVAGYSLSNDGEASYNHGYIDFLVVKLDPNGTTEWYKCLGGSIADWAYGIQQTADGGYIVAGSTDSNDGDVSGNHGASDFWVAKIKPQTTPTTPTQPLGPALGSPGVSYSYTTSATDPNGGPLKYTFDWGDETASSQTGYISSGTTASASHAWSNIGTYQARVRAENDSGVLSDWSNPLTVTIDASGPPLNKCLGGNGSDVAQSVQQTSDGGYIVAGYTESNDGDVNGYLGSTDAWVVKLDANHAIQWQRCLGTNTSIDYAYNIQQTADGGYVFAGSVSYSAFYIWAWVAKLSSSGDMEWQKYFDSACSANSIHQTTDGGYIVAGMIGNSIDRNFWIAKLAPNGAAEWEKTLGGSYFDGANSVQQTSDGGYVVTGYANSYDGNVGGNHGGSDLWVVKLNSGGDMQWQKCLGGSDNDGGTSIQQTTDGGYIIAGYTSSNNGDVSLNQGSEDYWVVKIDSEGTIQWQRCLGGSTADAANSVRQTSDGGYVVAGYSLSNDGEASYNHGYIDFLVVKLDPNGTTEWYKCLGGNGIDVAQSVQQTSDGGYIVAGSTYSNDGDVSGNHGASDFWVAKIAPTTPPTNPTTPPQPQGPALGMPGVSYIYSTSATDPDGDQVKYTFDWGDGSTDTTNLVDSGTAASASHAWSNPGTYQIKAKATDSKGASSGWSEGANVGITDSSGAKIDLSLFIEDAITGEDALMVVNKAPGDKIDVVAALKPRESYDRVTLALSVPSELGAPEKVFTRESFSSLNENSLSSSTSVDLSNIESGRDIQVVWRFKIIDSASPGDKVIKIEVNGDSGFPVKNEAKFKVVKSINAIIVTNRYLLYKYYDEGEVNELLAYLYKIANGDSLGEIPSIIYYVDHYDPSLENWNQVISDNDYKSGEDKINVVAQKIHILIKGWSKNLLQNSPHLMLVGGDEIIPFYRHKYKPIWPFKHEYDTPDDPVLATYDKGYFITDKYYAAEDSNEWNNKGLTDLAIGRIIGSNALNMQKLIRSGIESPTQSQKAIVATWNSGSPYNDILSKLRDEKHFDIFNDIEYPLTVNSNKWKSQDILDIIKSNYFSIFFHSSHGDYDQLSSAMNQDDMISPANIEAFPINNAIDKCRPLITTVACHTSVVPRSQDSLANAFAQSGASGYIGQTSYGLASRFSTSWTDALMNSFYKNLIKDSVETNTVGMALRDATNDYFKSWRISVYSDVTLRETQLYGVPWMRLDPPKSEKIQKNISDAIAINISDPIFTSDSNYTRTIEINVSKYTISKINGSDIININGSQPLIEDLNPIIPEVSIELNLPKNSNILNLSIISNKSLDIGKHNIPCAYPVLIGTNEAELGSCVNNSVFHPYPIYGYNLINLGENAKLTIDLALIQYNRTTNVTILNNFTSLNLTYHVSTPLVIGKFSVEKVSYANNEPINTSFSIENIGPNIITGLVSTINIKDIYGRIRVSKSIIASDIGPGDSNNLNLEMNQNLPHGFYVLEMNIKNSTGNLLGTATESIYISTGVITDFTSSTGVLMGNNVSFNIAFNNSNSTSVQATGIVSVFGPNSIELTNIESLPITIASGSQGQIELNWNTSGQEPGVYKAAAYVYANGEYFGPEYTDFTIHKRIYYPDFTDTSDPNSWRSWLVLQNPNEAATNVTLSIRSRSGDMLYQGDNLISPYGVSAIRPRNLAGADCAGSVIVSSDQPITGTCQITRNSNEMCMGYNALDSASTTLYYPDFTDTANPDGWRSWLVIQNPAASPANLDIEIRSRAGDILYSGEQIIPANGVNAIRPRNLAGSDCAGSVFIESDRSVIGTCQITRNSNKMCMSYTASDHGSTALYYPDFTDTANPDGWRSWLVLQNPSDAPANLNYEIRSRAGDILYAGSDIIPAHGVNAVRPRNLAGADCSGSVVVNSDQPIVGTCQITRNSNQMCMSYNALDQSSTVLNYPDFTDTANPDGWRSWLVLQNPTAADASITLEIRSREGDLLYGGDQIIPAHRVNAIRPRNLVGSDCSGSVTVTSDQPIVGTCQITRNNNLMCMSYTAIA